MLDCSKQLRELSVGAALHVQQLFDLLQNMNNCRLYIKKSTLKSGAACNKWKTTQTRILFRPDEMKQHWWKWSKQAKLWAVKPKARALGRWNPQTEESRCQVIIHWVFVTASRHCHVRCGYLLCCQCKTVVFKVGSGNPWGYIRGFKGIPDFFLKFLPLSLWKIFFPQMSLYFFPNFHTICTYIYKKKWCYSVPEKKNKIKKVV